MSSRDYDPLAWFYDRYWGPRFHDAARPALESLLYSRLRIGDAIAELCCGSGHLTQELLARGYRITGIDNSIEMLLAARRRAPAARLVCGDIGRSPLTGGHFSGAVSTFDSINHLLSPEAVKTTFQFVHGSLRTGGVFVFDVNTEVAYQCEWGKCSAIVETDAALFVRGGYDARARFGRTIITMFRLLDEWRRSDVEIVQRCYDERELAGWLFEAGFRDVSVRTAAAAGMSGDLARGRAFLTAQKGEG
jgi:SAM-dependent methyltransferase